MSIQPLFVNAFRPGIVVHRKSSPAERRGSKMRNHKPRLELYKKTHH